MDSQTLTLRELSDQVGIEPRTIRSYIQQGLLRGPEGLGPKAKYGPYHLGRLRAIKVLKESEGKSLAEIRMLLVSAPDGEVDAIAARFRETPEGAAPPVTGSTSALDYLRAVKQAMGGDWTGGAPQAPPATFAAAIAAAPADFRRKADEDRQSPLERAIEHLAAASGDRRPARKARGEPRFHIPVLPDVELSIRGARSPEELAQFERLADLLRDILMGGHDGPKRP